LTIDMSKKMAAAGADVVLVLPPSYFKSSMTGAAMKKHFLAVADASPVPLVLYNMPANTGLDIPPEVCVELADHANIIGLKDSGGDITRIASIVTNTRGKGFEVLAGSAGFLYPALCIGATGGVCALANMAGAECCEMLEHFHAGRHNEARELNERMIRANASVTRKMGVPALKVAMEWRGYYGGPCRAPLMPLTDAQVKELRADMEASGLLPVSKV
jgi:4-hydroxy-2-oxoglutarate aldolase